jgi:hypothetical protein
MNHIYKINYTFINHIKLLVIIIIGNQNAKTTRPLVASSPYQPATSKPDYLVAETKKGGCKATSLQPNIPLWHPVTHLTSSRPRRSKNKKYDMAKEQSGKDRGARADVSLLPQSQTPGLFSFALVSDLMVRFSQYREACVFPIYRTSTP